MRVYVRLRVAAEAYAMPVEHVREVAELGQVQAVPGARPEMLGVQEPARPDPARGRPGGPARAGRGRAAGPPAGGRGGRAPAGFAIDEVSDVGELPDPAEEAESDLLVGATLADGELTGVIDVPRVFDALAGTRP